MSNILIQKQNSAVIIFAKYPEPGKVKTRLALSTGNLFAAEFYKICAGHIFREIKKVNAQGFLFIPESDNIRFVENWAGKDFIYKRQIGNSLGEKMKNAFQLVFNQGFSNAIVVGTDVPAIISEVIESAFYSLKQNDVVISPSDDGGYSLLGMKQLFPGLLADIPWSTDRVLPTTLSKLKNQKIQYKILPPLHDVDTIDDLLKYLRDNELTRENTLFQMKNAILKIIKETNIEL